MHCKHTLGDRDGSNGGHTWRLSRRCSSIRIQSSRTHSQGDEEDNSVRHICVCLAQCSNNDMHSWMHAHLALEQTFLTSSSLVGQVGQVGRCTSMHRKSQVGLLDPSIYRSGLEGLVVLEDLVFRHTCASNPDRCLVYLGVLVVLEVLAVRQLRGLAGLVALAILPPERGYVCHLEALEGQVAPDRLGTLLDLTAYCLRSVGQDSQDARQAQDPLDARRDQEVQNGQEGLAVTGLVVLVDQEVRELSYCHQNLLNDLLVLVVLDHPSALLVPSALPILGLLTLLCVLEARCGLVGQDCHLAHPDHRLHHGLLVLLSHRRP